MVYNPDNETAREVQLFNCKRCGDCCHGYGGTVVSKQDIIRIAAYLGKDSTSFVDECCEFSGTKPILTQNKDGYCIFWNKICTIHPVKPRMCREWPFIPGLLVDPHNWQIMASMCPGMSPKPPFHLVERALRETRGFNIPAKR